MYRDAKETNERKEIQTVKKPSKNRKIKNRRKLILLTTQICQFRSTKGKNTNAQKISSSTKKKDMNNYRKMETKGDC